MLCRFFVTGLLRMTFKWRGSLAIKSGFGIAIGQHSIKLVELRKEKTGIQLSGVKVVKTKIGPSLNKEEKLIL